jgi:hypothetical protein
MGLWGQGKGGLMLIPNRGNWDTRLLDSNSTATFVKGSLVALNPRRLLVEYTSVSSTPVGIALQDSADSLPAGKVCVAIPTAGCTFWAQTGTLALSALSLGQTVGIKKSGNTMDQVDAVLTSAVSALGHIYGTIKDTSSVSVIEVMWAPTQHVFGSASSNTFAS